MARPHVVILAGRSAPDLGAWFDPTRAWRVRVDPTAAAYATAVRQALPHADVHVGAVGDDVDVVVVGEGSPELARLAGPTPWWRAWLAKGSLAAALAACGGPADDTATVHCGDRELDPGETCDGDVGVATCEAHGFSGGTLACRSDCQDVSASFCTFAASDLVLNEINHASEAFEVYNAGDATIDLAGWTATDRIEVAPDRAVALGLAPLAPGEILLVFPEYFGVGSDDVLTLRDPTGAVRDFLAWTDGADSLCRQPDGGAWLTCTPTLGAPNAP